MKSAPKHRRPVPPPRAAQNVTLRLQPEKLRGLDALARRLGVTRSAVIQIAIAEKLEGAPEKVR